MVTRLSSKSELQTRENRGEVEKSQTIPRRGDTATLGVLESCRCRDFRLSTKMVAEGSQEAILQLRRAMIDLGVPWYSAQQ